MLWNSGRVQIGCAYVAIDVIRLVKLTINTNANNIKVKWADEAWAWAGLGAGFRQSCGGFELNLKWLNWRTVFLLCFKDGATLNYITLLHAIIVISATITVSVWQFSGCQTLGKLDDLWIIKRKWGVGESFWRSVNAIVVKSIAAACLSDKLICISISISITISL